MRLRAASTAVLTSVLLLLTACGTDEPETAEAPTSEPAATEGESPQTPSPEPTQDSTADAPTTIEITISGHDVTPSGERVEVPVGEEIHLVVTADAPGELHVHSVPEQTLEYAAGTTTLPLTIDTPGIVEVESHDAHVVIVQLQVQ